MRVTRLTVARSFELFLLSSAVLAFAGCGSGGNTEATGGAGGRAGGGGAGTTKPVGGAAGGAVAGGAGATAVGGAVAGSTATTATGGTAAAGGASGTLSPDAGADSGRADLALATPDAGNPDAAVNPPAEVGADVPLLPADAAVVDAAISPDGGGSEAGGSGGVCPTARWSKALDLQSVSGLASDKDGNLFMSATLFKAGDFGSGAVTPAGSADLLIAKIDPATGKAAWTKLFGDASDQIAGKLAVAKSGQVGVIGAFTGSIAAGNTITNPAADTIDFVIAVDGSGTGLWAKAVDTKGGVLQDIAADPTQDAFAVCGYATGAATDLVPGATAQSDGMEDILVAKVNATTGAVLWSKQIGGSGSQLCNAVGMDAAGNVIAAGIYNGTLDFGSGAFSPAPASTSMAIWIAKLDGATGSTLAAKSFGNSMNQLVSAMAIDSSGNVAVAGLLRGVVGFGSFTLGNAGAGTSADGGTAGGASYSAFAVKLDGGLTPVWAHNWGANQKDVPASLAFDSKGDLLVVGSIFDKKADLGNGVVLSAATGVDSTLVQADAYWAKLDGDTGTALCGKNYGDDFRQQADLVAVSRLTSGPLADAITVAGSLNGTIDFGLSSGLIVAGVPGTSSANGLASFLLRVAQ